MKKQKKQLFKIIVAAIIFCGAFFAPNIWYLPDVMFLLSYLVIGLDVIKKALRNIVNGQVFDENFLMTLATFGAVALGEYSEAVGVMLFYQIGELFQSYAVNKSRRSVAALMDIRPDYANLKTKDGLKTVSPDEVLPGDVIVIRPGERVPLDGEIVKGDSLVDTSAITGESVPRELGVGSPIVSGCVNINVLLEVRVKSVYAESTVSKILDLVENSTVKKAKVEQFITKFARYYTPAVVLLAVALAVLPPLLITGESFADWVYRALTFLVISCPCALVISVPLSFFGGIGAASRQGILVKGGNYLQALSEAEIVVFDKTGTLTKGSFSVVDVNPEKISAAELLKYAAYAGVHSSHPVSQSIRTAYKGEIDISLVNAFEEIPAHGVSAVVDGRQIYVGSSRLLKKYQINYPEVNTVGSVIYVAVDGKFAGWIRIADEIKSDSKAAVADLKTMGVRRTVMLTGDTRRVGEDVAAELGLDEVCTELLPAGKVEKVEELLRGKSASGKLIFVGDGLNDAPVLARADIGIAMGGVGSDAAVEAADIVIMTDEPSKIAAAMRISKKTLTIVKQNIVFALAVKFAVLGMGAAGMATMWEAVFADVGVSVMAILNAIRTLYIRR